MLQRWPIVRKLKAAVTKATKGKQKKKKSAKAMATSWAKMKAPGWRRAPGTEGTGVSAHEAANEIIAAFPSLSVSAAIDIAYDVLYP